jgi:CRISPR system Cascade subunit CasA
MGQGVPARGVAPARISRASTDLDLLDRGQLAWEQKAWAEASRVADGVLATVDAGTFVGRKEKAKNGKEVRISLGTAERNFRSRLARTLSRAAQHRRETGSARTSAATTEGRSS